MAALPVRAGPVPEARAGEAAEPREAAVAPRHFPDPPRDPRASPVAMAWQAQELVTFEDVAVLLSREEWDTLAPGQRELYRNVMADTYELLTSLGYTGPKPDILHRLERGEEPWICPSPGHVRSWLEESPSGWWPRPSKCQGPEPSCPGQSTSWGLQASRLLKKFGCLEGWSQFPMGGDSGPGSQALPWLVKEEVEDNSGPVENLIQSGTFPIHSVPEQQDMDTWGQLWDEPRESHHGNIQSHGPGEAPGSYKLRVEELRVAAAKDHSYCLRSEPSAPGAPKVCPPREHNYSSATESRGLRRGRAFWTVRRRLLRQQSHLGAMFRKSREILRRYRPYGSRGFPWRGCAVCRARAPGKHPGVCPPAAAAAPGDTGSAKGATSDTRRAPDGILGTVASHPAPIPAVGVRKGARLPEDPRARRELEGCTESQKTPGVSLHDVFQNVLQALGSMLDSLCHKFEVQGISQGKSIWPIVIQIDNLTQVPKS